MSILSIFKKTTPEEAEAARKEAEVNALAESIAELRRQLLDEAAELKTFEREYTAHCAPAFRRLDRWELRAEEQDWLNQRLKEKSVDDLREWTSVLAESERQSAFAERWQNLKYEQAEAKQHEKSEAVGAAPELQEADLATLKSLYRELAKRFHPDGVLDPEAKAKRAALMAEINAAYAARDLAKLRKLAMNPDIVEQAAESIGDRLIRLIREIAVLREQESELQAELAVLRESPVATLRAKLDAAAQPGADRFAPVLDSVSRQIADAKRRWESLRADATAFWMNCD